MVENTTIISDSEDTSILEFSTELDISLLLDLLPEEERWEELKQVRVYCLISSVFPVVYFILFYFWFILLK